MLLALGALALVAAGIAIAWLPHPSATTTRARRRSRPSDRDSPRRRLPFREFIGIRFPTRSRARAGRPARRRRSSAPTKPPRDRDRPAACRQDRARQGSTVTLSSRRLDVDRTSTAATTTDETTTQATTTGRRRSDNDYRGTTRTHDDCSGAAATATMPDVTGQNEAAAATSMNRAGSSRASSSCPPRIRSAPCSNRRRRRARPSRTTRTCRSTSHGAERATDSHRAERVGKTLRQAVSTMNAANLRLIFVKFPVTSEPRRARSCSRHRSRRAGTGERAVLVYLGAFKYRRQRAAARAPVPPVLPAARLEQLARIERLRRDADHRLAEAGGDAGEHVRVEVVRRRLDDRAGALATGRPT